MLTALGIAFGIAVVLAITAVTGYFVAQEFAYMAVDRSRLKARAESGDTSAARALSVTRRTSFMLSGAQLGITVTGLLVGYVAEPLIGSGLGEAFGGLGIPTAVGVVFGTVLAVLFSTVIQMVFGELVPKNLAIARPEPVALWLALSTTIYLRLFGWLIRLFDASSNLLLRALRIEPVHDVEHSATPRDLEHIVAESRNAGELPKELSTLLDRILDFPTRTAEHSMIPRAHVDVVDLDEPVSDILAKMSTGHTRYPVVGTSSDDLRGVVHLHDLLDADVQTGTAASVCRPPVIVPATLPLPDVLTELTAANDEMALVIDEYGGVDGLVTFEDVIETLVGDVLDEHDIEDGPEWVADGPGSWLVQAGAALDDLEAEIGTRLRLADEDQEVDTLGGLAAMRAGRVPGKGEVIELENGARIEVIDAERHRIRRLCLTLPGPAVEEGAA